MLSKATLQKEKNLFVCGGGAAVDVHDIDQLLVGVHVKENPITANAAAPGGTLGFEAHDVAGKRVLLHFLQGGQEQPLAFSGYFCEQFFRPPCDAECPDHG